MNCFCRARSRYLPWLCFQAVLVLGCSGSDTSGTDQSPSESEAGRGAKGGDSVADAGSDAPAANTSVGASASGSGGNTSTSPAGGGAGGSATAANGGVGGEADRGGAAAAGSDDAGAAQALEPFSFFMTSYAAIQRLSGSPDGFGGDLRYGEADGLAGADKICTEIAESSLPGSGAKGWRAFLSVTKGPDGQPIHAADRIGQGPWYDRLGRLLAQTREDLINTRPMGADPAIVDDFPNEDGVPNHAPDGKEPVDNHDVLTGTNDKGQLFSSDWAFTCHDWTSAQGADGTPRVGHSWPRSMGGQGGTWRPRMPAAGSGGPRGGTTGPVDMNNWMSSLNEAGCAPGASLIEMGPPDPNNPTVGSGGGYGAIYCFALKP